MNVLKMMIIIIICFIMFFSFIDIYNLFQFLGVSILFIAISYQNATKF